MSGGMWAAIGGIFGLILLALVVVTIVDIFRSDLGAGKTAAWVIIVLLVPFIGAALYLALRKPSADEVQSQVDGERALRESARRQGFDSTGIS
jgi:uncharacterized membrane protein